MFSGLLLNLIVLAVVLNEIYDHFVNFMFISAFSFENKILILIDIQSQVRLRY